MKLPSLTGSLCAKVAIALFFTGSLAVAQDNGSSNSNDVSGLKAQIESLEKKQQEYQDRITSMEAQMKSLESKAESGSILNTRVLTDADGKEVSAAPTLDESFLKSLTRNFTFSAYIRAGFQFNGNGGGGNFSFELPNFPGEGRERLGNENDTYMELTWMQSHMLGDSPDVMDVSMTFTPAIRYVQNRATFDAQNNVTRSGNDFDFILRQAYLEASNVFKGAPEITFWSGVRFYDRYNTDPEDYFWLDTSGYGAGVENIDLGIGKLNVAWLGGLAAQDISPGIGSYFKQTFDARLKDIALGPIPGTLALVLIGNYEKGGTFTQDYDSAGNIVNLTNPLHTDAAWGIGGGAIYNIKFGPGGANNSFTAYALFGRGVTNFGSGADLGSVQGAENLFLFRHPGYTGEINVGDALNHGFTYRAGFQLYFAFPWYSSAPAPVVAGNSKDGKTVAPPAPAPAPGAPWFSVAFFGDWEDSYSGFAFGGTTGPGLGQGNNVVNANEPIVSKVVSGHVHDFQFGTRPAVWLADNIALQGQFSGQYESNNNIAGYPGFGKSGWLGVFDVGPVIKPKGGYYTKPEIRFFATYAVWSNSLKGMTTPIQEGSGGGGGFAAPYNGNTNHGWLFGTQVEWFF
ncbi:MAG: carbohydrate porin [Verrucomicrobia bacterium]|nr:carbohydrate porin [Verrucomicrobiota bacterium]MBV8486466.1 carbohydrate porin [Verrucomicrobiota bacterium]